MKSFSYGFSEGSICKGSGYKPPNLHKWGPGVRDVFALHYIVSGKGYLKTQHTTFFLETGESFIIFPQMEVYYYPDPLDPWEYFWIEFYGGEASRLLSMINFTPNSPVVVASPQDLGPLFHVSKSAELEPFERERSDAKLHLLLSYYMEYYPSDKAFLTKDYTLSAREYIESNFWKPSLSVLDVVDYVKIERSYLFRLFKEENGVSISGYLTTFRIQRACELLRTSHLSVKSIAYSVGYQDPLYFSKVFKKETSYTPSEYKKAYNAGNTSSHFK
ncbi:helix-turn-helix domain-containing protein [Paenibacillus sp. LC-T2]|uniref:Helix-turn-helix domain-containing protein n=2 Tax=Paenibacillus monticola TaxID=2666075 RepID=A0A7X2H226_9BACL|nr:AraC family transcriptional regulator [Paenibacillus monticola]MRN52100.1 helix-turn-helix domain-containing protein [Paenibacillus monticola]